MIQIIVLSITSASLAVYLLYKRYDNNVYKKIRNINTNELVPKAPYIISLASIRDRKILRDRVITYGNIYYFYLTGLPTLVVADPLIIKEILIQKQYQFVKGGFFEILGSLFGLKNLVFAEGEEWKTQRKIIAPAFRATTIQQLLPEIQAVCEKCIKNLNGTVDFTQAVTKYTLNVITAVAFNGLDAEDEINNSFREGIRVLFKYILFYTVPILKLIPNSMKGKAKIEAFAAVFNKWVYKVIESVTNKPADQSYPNFTKLLVNARDDSGNALSSQEIIDNIKIFYFAGHETTATLLTYAFYYMTKYPEVNKKIQEEVDSVLGNSKEITLDHIEKLVYVQAVIKETLRLKGPANLISRFPAEDSNLGGYFVPKGVRILLLFDALHRDSKYWENPNDFIPERWFKIDEAKARGDGYYMPFSTGQRICIGQRLAREESIVFLVKVAQNFNIKAAYNTDIEPVPDTQNGTFRPSSLNITFENRI